MEKVLILQLISDKAMDWFPIYRYGLDSIEALCIKSFQGFKSIFVIFCFDELILFQILYDFINHPADLTV